MSADETRRQRIDELVTLLDPDGANRALREWASGRVFIIDEAMLERAAAALLGELVTDGIKACVERDSYDKETLRLAAKRVLAAAADPLWGKR